MRRWIVGLLVVLMIAASGCVRGKNRYQAEFLSLFDTVTMIVGYAENEQEFTELAKEIKKKLTEYHQLYDIYNNYEGINNLKTINDNAGKAPVKVDERLLSLIKFAKQQYYATNGKINIAFGPVLAIWHDYRTRGIENPEEAELPPRKLLLNAAQHTDIEGVIINEEASTVFLKDPQMRLDVGAVAKGYAVERVVQELESQGVTSLILSVGGNVRTIGGKPGKRGTEPWRIGIKNPDEDSPDTELCSIAVTDQSVVSSGSYERYYTVDGIRYHHIIDPRTLMPAAYVTSVTIVCQDSGLADVLSTAVFNMPYEEGRAFIEGIDGVEALWVTNTGQVRYTDGFKKMMVNDKK